MYCKSCGATLSGNSMVCPSCGQTLTMNGQMGSDTGGIVILPNETTNWLSRRVQANGVVWIFIAIYQIIAGIFLTGVGYGFAMIACGVWNIVQSILDLRFSKQILHCNNMGRARAIIQSIDRSKGVTILFLFLNLAIGGVLGVIGCIYWLALRSKALDRAPEMGVYD